MKQDNDALKRIIARFEQQWQGEAQKAVKRLYELMDKGLKVEPALQKLRKEFPALFQLTQLEDALIEAAAYGYGVMPSVLTSADKAAMLTALDKPWSADGMRLSEKLHTGGEAMLKAIQDTVQMQIRKNATAIQIARELYDGYNSGKAVTQRHDMAQYMRRIEMLQGESWESNSALRQAERNINRLGQNGAPNQALKAAYNKLLEAVEDGNDKALQKAAKVAVEEKSRYIADRIARTEMARAYADGFFSKHQDNPNVVAYEFKLSTRHPAFDVCNMYADSNMFNLGVGVYPKDKVPLVPVHPHCLCKYKAIFKSQIDISKQKDRRNSEMVRWVNKLPEIQAKSVLGVRGYTAYKAAKTAYNERKSKTNSNISIKDLASLITQNMRGFVPLQHPRYRDINIGDFAQYKYIRYKDKEAKSEQFYKGDKTISVRRIYNGKINTVVANNIEFNMGMLNELNSQIDFISRKMGLIKFDNFPRIAIVSEKDISENTAGAYIAANNTLYINHGLLRKNGLADYFKNEIKPVSTDKHSTLVHELYHWRDAQQYIKENGKIINQNDYVAAINAISKKKVAKLVKMGYNIKQISGYAEEMLAAHRYDEVITEYRTKVLLEGKEAVKKILTEGEVK